MIFDHYICPLPFTANSEMIEPLGRKYSPGSLFTCGVCANRTMPNISNLHSYRSTKPRVSSQRINIECRATSFGIALFVQAPPINKNQKVYFRPSGSIVSELAVTNWTDSDFDRISKPTMMRQMMLALSDWHHHDQDVLPCL